MNDTVVWTDLLGLNEERTWLSLAACREADAFIFFPGPDGDTSAALRICSTCPVREECLAYALEARERYGIWGGTTERERRRLLRRAG